MGSKGIVGTSVALALAIITVTMILTIIIPLFFFKVHTTRTLEIEYGYDNAENTLLTLLSDRPSYRTIGMYFAGYPDDPMLGFTRTNAEKIIKDKLELLAPGGCFLLSSGTYEIKSDKVASGGCELKYSAEADVASPLSSLKSKVTLKITDMGMPTPIVPSNIRYCCYYLSGYDMTSTCQTTENCRTIGGTIYDQSVICSDSSTDCPDERY